VEKKISKAFYFVCGFHELESARGGPAP